MVQEVKMRDIERIDKILEKIGKLWKEKPDQRFGQFLENYVFGHHLDRNCCIFYHEDDMIEKKLNVLHGIVFEET